MGRKYVKTISYMNRGEKYLLVTDNQGGVSIFKRGAILIERIDTGADIIDFQKNSVALFVMSKNQINFISFFDRRISSKTCNAGTYNLTGFTIDPSNSGHIYA